MKKSILILVLATVASISISWGQALPGSAPRDLDLENCEIGPLSPIAGVPFNYSALLDPEGGAAYWFATTATQFIDEGALTDDQELIGGDYVSAATNYRGFTGPDPVGSASSPDTTTITWNSIGLAQISPANPLFVALNYTADPANGCANNLKVFRINPINAFLVNIKNLDAPTYDVGAESCFSEIETAEYILASNSMHYDYGKNLMAFEIIAANFTEFYDISFRIEGLLDEQDAEIYWNFTNNFLTANQLADGPFGNEQVLGPQVTTSEPSTQYGVSIYVWLEVNNNGFEGLEDTPVTLAVAGVNAAGQPNVRWDNCSTPVDLAAAFGNPEAPDNATHTLKARPTVLPGEGLNFEE